MKHKYWRPVARGAAIMVAIIIAGHVPVGVEGWWMRVALLVVLVAIIEASNPRTTTSPTTNDHVLAAALAYVREVENPAPDLLHRAHLRNRLRAAVKEMGADRG